MKKWSRSSEYSPPKAIASVNAPKITSVFTGTKGGGRGETSYETKSQMSYGDKQSGSYRRGTAVEKASTGEFSWKNGTTGVKNEYTRSSTVRVGDQRGYTEVYREERIRDVIYNKSTESSSSKSIVTREPEPEPESESDNDKEYFMSVWGYDSDSD